jgi:hypothetical protein
MARTPVIAEERLRTILRAGLHHWIDADQPARRAATNIDCDQCTTRAFRALKAAAWKPGNRVSMLDIDREAAMTKLDSGGTTTAATHEDITSILGNIDQAKLLEIISLQPTIADIEQASLWLSGDADVFGADAPVKGKASDIVTILTENEEEEPPPAA